jgi:hypothetical protein
MRILLPVMALCCNFMAHPLSPPAHAADVDHELLKTAIAGNSGTVGMIERYHAKVLLESEAIAGGKRFGPLKQSAEYWRTGENYRSRSRSGDTFTELERERGRVRFFNAKAKNDQPDLSDPSISIIISDPDRRCVDTDPWELSLFSLPVGIKSKPPKRMYDLAGLIETGTVSEAAWVELQGRKMMYASVALQPEHRSYEVWASPSFNWALVKVIHRTTDERGEPEWYFEYEADRFVEACPSVYVPALVRVIARHGKDSEYKGTATLSDIVVNQNLPPAPRFALPPAGPMAFDESSGATFRLDGRGNPVGKVRKFGEWYVPPTRPEKQTSSYSSRIGWTIVVVAASLFAAGVVRARGRRRAGPV